MNRVKVTDLNPGDRFIARGRTYLVVGQPTVFANVGIVTIPVSGTPTEVEFVTGWTVLLTERNP